MINAAHIRELIDNEVKRLDLFLVDIIVSPGNKIAVFVDSIKGVTLEECMFVSKFLESKLDRNVEDYELEVSSPGLDRPLKLPVQYEKNAGRSLDVVKTDGIKVTGRLLGYKDGVIEMETMVKVKDSKGKKRTELTVQHIKQEEIKTAKVVISLKK